MNYGYRSVAIFGVLSLLAVGAPRARAAEQPAPPAEPAAEPAPAPAATESKAADATSFPSDDDRLDGDHLKLRVNAWGFKSIDGADKTTEHCAPKGSTLIVTQQNDDELFVRVELDKLVKKAAKEDRERERLRKLAAPGPLRRPALERPNPTRLHPPG